MNFEEEARARIRAREVQREAQRAAEEAANADRRRSEAIAAQRHHERVQRALTEWPRAAKAEGVPTFRLEFRQPTRWGGIFGGGVEKVRHVWVFSEYHRETPDETRGLMTPGSPEIPGVAIDEDGHLHHFRGLAYPKGATLTAVRLPDGSFSVPETPLINEETLNIMFEAPIEGWWVSLSLLVGVRKEGKEDRFRFKDSGRPARG